MKTHQTCGQAAKVSKSRWIAYATASAASTISWHAHELELSGALKGAFEIEPDQLRAIRVGNPACPVGGRGQRELRRFSGFDHGGFFLFAASH